MWRCSTFFRELIEVLQGIILYLDVTRELRDPNRACNGRRGFIFIPIMRSKLFVLLLEIPKVDKSTWGLLLRDEFGYCDLDRRVALRNRLSPDLNCKMHFKSKLMKILETAHRLEVVCCLTIDKCM